MAGAPIQYREAFDRIRLILVREWDPILDGIGGIPDDEYDSYIPTIYRLIQEGSNEREIAAKLEHIETEFMGLRPDPERNLRIARRLLEVTITD